MWRLSSSRMFRSMPRMNELPVTVKPRPLVMWMLAGLVADVVSGDAPQSDLVRCPGRADPADVGAAGGRTGLDGVAADGAFADAAFAAVDPDVGRLFGLPVVVVFDVVSGDLQVPDRAADDPNSALPAEADVASLDDRLVEIDLVQQQPGAAAVVEVAGVQDEVAVALAQDDAIPDAADQHASHDGLQRVEELDSIGFGMSPHDLEVLHHRHPLLSPDLVADRLRTGRALVRSQETESRSGARHDHGPGVAAETDRSRLGQTDFDRSR
jgi:hypothetical protein